MDDKDLFVTLEANIIEAVKRLVQNARNEFLARSSQGKVITGGAKSPSAGATRSTAVTRVKSSATSGDASKSFSKSLTDPSPVTTPKKAPADAAGADAATPKKAATEPAGTEAATPKKSETKETDSASAPAASPEEAPAENPVLVTSESGTATEEGAPATAPAPAEEPVALTPEEEAKRQWDELALDVDSNLHSMKHASSDRPKLSRRKTHAGSTNPKFDPTAPATPEPAIVALVPEPTEEERIRARVQSMAGPRMPMVNLGDLQKRGGRGGAGRGGGGRGGGEAGDAPARRQTSVDGVARPFNPRPLSEFKPLSTPTATASAEPSPKSPAAEAVKPEAAPAEPAKLSDSTEGLEPPALPQVLVSDEEAPPLPLSSTPLSPLWSPVQSPSTDVGEPEHLSLDATPARRSSTGTAPALPSDPAPAHAKVAAPKPPAPRSPVPGPAPPPGHNPHHSPSPSGPHHHGPAPPPARVMSPPPGARKISAVDRAPSAQSLELQVDGEGAPPIPLSSPLAEGEGGGEEPVQKLSSVMNAARARQPMINLADITKPRTPKVDGGKPPGTPTAPQAAVAAVPKCECGCTKFVMNPFKKGTNCSTCFHQHPAS